MQYCFVCFICFVPAILVTRAKALWNDYLAARLSIEDAQAQWHQRKLRKIATCTKPSVSGLNQPPIWGAKFDLTTSSNPFRDDDLPPSSNWKFSKTLRGARKLSNGCDSGHTLQSPAWTLSLLTCNERNRRG